MLGKCFRRCCWHSFLFALDTVRFYLWSTAKFARRKCVLRPGITEYIFLAQFSPCVEMFMARVMTFIGALCPQKWNLHCKMCFRWPAKIQKWERTGDRIRFVAGNIPQKSGEKMLNDDDVQLCTGKNINQRKQNKKQKNSQNVRRERKHENKNENVEAASGPFALDCVICELRNLRNFRVDLWHQSLERSEQQIIFNDVQTHASHADHVH